jgi:hypothetical protein
MQLQSTLSHAVANKNSHKFAVLSNSSRKIKQKAKKATNLTSLNFTLKKNLGLELLFQNIWVVSISTATVFKNITTCY